MKNNSKRFDSTEDFVGYYTNKIVKKELESLFEEGIYYSRSESLDILGYPHNLVGWIKLWLFIRKDHFANYWKCYNLRHIHKGFYWTWYDWLGW